MGDQGGFIYTPKTSLAPEADGKFCCRTVKKGSTTFTGAVPRDWMKTATYAGTYDSFKGDHYSGAIKMFTWQQAGLYFWYYAKPDGSPVQQGESCKNPAGKKPVACSKMMPITLYHDWSDFRNATFTASDFTVPDVCKSTTVSCAIPGNNLEAPSILIWVVGVVSIVFFIGAGGFCMFRRRKRAQAMPPLLDASEVRAEENDVAFKSSGEHPTTPEV